MTMSPKAFKLIHEKDFAEWPTMALCPEGALQILSQKIGKKFALSHEPSAYRLAADDLYNGSMIWNPSEIYNVIEI